MSNCGPIRDRLSCLDGFPSLGRCRPAGASILTCRHPSWLGVSVLRSCSGLLDVPFLIITPTLRQRPSPRHYAATAQRRTAWLKSHSILRSQHRQGAASRAQASLTKRPSATSTGCRASSTRRQTAFVDRCALLTLSSISRRLCLTSRASLTRLRHETGVLGVKATIADRISAPGAEQLHLFHHGSGFGAFPNSLVSKHGPCR